MNVKLSNMLARIMGSLGYTTIITFVALTMLLVNGEEPLLIEIWKNILGSMIMSIFFALSSYLFEVQHWSPLKQVTIHFTLSVVIFFPVAIWAGWLPVKLSILLVGLLVFIGIYICFWIGFSLYYRRQIADMNRKINDN